VLQFGISQVSIRKRDKNMEDIQNPQKLKNKKKWVQKKESTSLNHRLV